MTQTEINFTPRGGGLQCTVPDAATQQGKILRHLQRGGSLTVAEALSQYGCYALSQRIGELKRMGWPIISERYRTPGGAVVARYMMAEAA